VAKILIVENDELFISQLSEFLRAEHEILVVSDGADAKERLQEAAFDLVICETQVSLMSGIELLAWVNANLDIPVIMMTKDKNILGPEAAHDLGATAYFEKPLELNQLHESIKNILISTPLSPKKSGDVYYAVSLEEILEKKCLNFDIYIHLTHERFAKIASEGDAPPRKRLYDFREKGVQFLYIKNSDFKKLVEFIEPKEVLKLNSKSKVRTDEILDAAQLKIKSIPFHGNWREKPFQFSRDFLLASIELVAQNFPAEVSQEKLLKNMNLAMYAISIAYKMDYRSSPLFFKMILASLFCDDLEIETLASTFKIPTDTVQIARDLKKVKSGVAIEKFELHPISAILVTADRFLDSADNLQKKSEVPIDLASTLKYLEAETISQLSAPSFNALKSLFQPIAPH
jgi:CheY-like chemotaxis protein